MSGYQPQNYMTPRRKSSVTSNSQDHLWGIRAVLAVQSFAWLFFKVFNPTLTIPSATPTGEHVPEASPSTVPGVFGGPGIVGPGADSGIVSGSSLQGRDLFRRSLSKLILTFSFSKSRRKWKEAASDAGKQRLARRNIGLAARHASTASPRRPSHNAPCLSVVVFRASRWQGALKLQLRCRKLRGGARWREVWLSELCPTQGRAEQERAAPAVVFCRGARRLPVSVSTPTFLASVALSAQEFHS